MSAPLDARTQVVGQFLAAIDDDGGGVLVAPTKADVGLDQVDNTSDATKNAAPAVLENKQIVDRVGTCTPVANVITPNADSMDVCEYYALTATTMIATPTASGSNPRNHQRLTISLASAAAQTLTWDTGYAADCGQPLPTSTVPSATLPFIHLLLEYQSTSAHWCLLASNMAPGRRVTTLTSSATFTCPQALADQCEMAMTGAAGSLTMAAPTGSPNNGDLVLFILLCTNAQTFSWNAVFIASPSIALPSTCPASTTVPNAYGFRFSALVSKWQLLSVN